MSLLLSRHVLMLELSNLEFWILIGLTVVQLQISFILICSLFIASIVMTYTVDAPKNLYNRC